MMECKPGLIVFILVLESLVFTFIVGFTLTGLIMPQILGIVIVLLLLLFLIVFFILIIMKLSKVNFSVIFLGLFFFVLFFTHISIILMYISTGQIGCFNC
jgi:hypothetical protein